MPDRGIDVPPATRAALDSLSLLAGKWHPVVVAVLSHHGPLGFNDLLEAIPDVSGKVLSGTLEALQDADLVDRRVVTESPLRVEYALTDAGVDMDPVFDALATWGERHLEEVAPTILIADSDRRLTEMYAGWLADRYTVVRAHSREALTARLDASVDVVLYDAGFPGTNPYDVIEAAGEGSRVVALVGDRPDFELLGVPFDDLRRKPIVRETAIETIEWQLHRRGEPPDQRERASLAARRTLFESVYPRSRLEATAAYVDLRSQLDALDGRLTT